MLTEQDCVFRQKRNADGTRDQISFAVNIPLQTKDYKSKFDKIDKRNLKDAEYN